MAYYNTIQSSRGFIPYKPPINKQDQHDKNVEISDENKPRQELSQEQSKQPRPAYKPLPVKMMPIEEVLADFKKTLSALGTSGEIQEEVNTYFELIHKQSLKEKPSKVIIKSNLKNAAKILDEYISETLQKQSKVVSNWVDALLTQPINFRSEPVKLVEETPDSENILQDQSIKVDASSLSPNSNTEQSLKVIDRDMPSFEKLENQKLKEFIEKTEAIIDKKNYDKAIENLEKALKFSNKLDEKNAQPQIYMNLGFVYDEINQPAKALEYYNNAANAAKNVGDNITRAKAHYNMGSIYDDFNKDELAVEHYFASIALDGETNSPISQAQTLNDIGVIESKNYNYEKALEFYKLAFEITEPEDNNLGKATILSNTASVFENVGFDKKALKFYKRSAKYDMRASNPIGFAETFEKAGMLLAKNGQAKKAKNLLTKSMSTYQDLNDMSVASKLNKFISTL